jgi:hypothetical protein
MPFPTENKYARLSFGGQDASGEVWSTGIDMIGADALVNPSIAQATDFAQDALSIFNTTLWNPTNGLKSFNTSVVTLDRARVAFYDNGAVVQVAEVGQTAVPGTTSTGVMPGYVSLCITQHTTAATRNFRGRRYLPITAASLPSSNLQFTAANVTTLVTAYRDTLAALNLAALGPYAGLDWACSVISLTAAASRPITQVSADTIPDTQHRRNRSVSAVAKVFSAAI